MSAVVRVSGCQVTEEEGQDEDIAHLTQQLAAFSTSDDGSGYHGSTVQQDLSVLEAESGFHSDVVGSYAPPPSPISSSPLQTEPLQSIPHTSFLSHPHSHFPPSLSSLCEMEEPSPSPSSCTNPASQL